MSEEINVKRPYLVRLFDKREVKYWRSRVGRACRVTSGLESVEFWPDLWRERGVMPRLRLSPF